MSEHVGFTDRVMAFFRSHPSRWVNATELEAVGGRQAWRTRTSEARQRFLAAGEGTILNRTRHRAGSHGERWVVSEYAFLPAVVVKPDESQSQGHDVNAWGLR